jgi:hypothetical protein
MLRLRILRRRAGFGIGIGLDELALDKGLLADRRQCPTIAVTACARSAADFPIQHET